VFTGLVEEVGKVRGILKRSGGVQLRVECSKVIEDSKVGDSICVNGVCLTVVEVKGSSLTFFLSPETLKRSSLYLLKVGDFVNLERALKLSDRLGGHILQGHVDATTKVTGIKREGESFRFTFALPRNFAHLLVEKGSIGIDGISLTVASISPNSFSVAVIPHTYENTNLKLKRTGDLVNLEFDIIGKYVERMLKLNKVYNK